MSIRDAEAGRKRQQAERASRRSKEAEARPDAVHRALIFLLKETKQNNPDASEEANHFIQLLDAELAASPEKVKALESPAPVEAEPDAEGNPDEAEKPNTAATVKRSRRFSRS